MKEKEKDIWSQKPRSGQPVRLREAMKVRDTEVRKEISPEAKGKGREG